MSKFVHHELNTSDPAAAKKFYKGVFGWKFSDVPMPGGTYTMISTAEGDNIGGLQQHPMPGAPASWLNYATVPSVKRTLKKAEGRGASVLQPFTEIPNMGRFAIIADPQGAVFAIWEELAAAPAKKAAKKKTAKKAAKKKPAKKAAKKKPAKKAAKKKPAKKAAKKTPAKKAAKKTPAKKAAKKKPAKKAAKKKTTKRAAKKKR